ncbi:YxeA family protein [Companilactobacillus kimchiensis]|uniref:YxeA family protein n=1 Tax=Companilactobacillus kimchiensis TaxID=993692 RepID=A0A0R2KXX0_9LACO|nr:YxeA family protein [Companilactobacillus kimchiensis]KRN94395.1 hypothetical protein IV57_GL002155 [Companilactobacillus kimchiensis]
MKKFHDIFFMTLIFLGLAYFMTGSFVKDKTSPLAKNFNQYNLLAKRSPKFIQIDHAASDKEDDGSYTYYADGFDRQGMGHEVEFNSDEDLADGQLIKLDTKGSYIKDYKKIEPNDMPYKVYKIFGINE